jgi:MFS family permease
MRDNSSDESGDKSAGQSNADRIAYAEGFVDARAKSEFWRFGAAVFLVSFLYSHGALFAVVFTREGFDLHSVGLLLSLYVFPVLLTSFTIGWVAGQIGVLATTRTAICCVIVGFATLYFTVDSFYGALASRMIQGLGQGLFLGSILTYAQSLLSPRRFVYLLGVFSTMAPLSQAFAPPFGAVILNSLGPKPMFLIATVPALAGLALTFTVRTLPRAGKPRGLAFGRALRRDRIAPLTAGFVNGTMFGFVMAYLAAVLEAKALPIGAFFIASTAAMLAGRLLAMRRMEAIDRHLLVGGGFVLEAIAFTAIALAGGSWLIIVAGVLFGMGYSVIYPILSAWMSDGLEPNERVGPQGLLNSIFCLGMFAMPFPQTYLIEAIGYNATLICLAGMAIICAAALTVAALRHPQAGH